MPNGIPDEEPRPGLLRPDDPDTVYSVMDYEIKIEHTIPMREKTFFENMINFVFWLLLIIHSIKFLWSFV